MKKLFLCSLLPRATARQLVAPPDWPTLDASARHEAMYRLALHHLPYAYATHDGA